MPNDPLEDLFDKPAPRDRRRALDPDFQTQVDEILTSLKQRGLNARLSEGYRTPEKQDEYYSQGRTRPGPIITNARGTQGRHTRGMAADIDLLDASGRPLADNDPQWSVLGEEAGRRGLTWGGAWKLRDFRHVESRRGQTRPVAPKPQRDGLGDLMDDPLGDLFDKTTPKQPTARSTPNVPIEVALKRLTEQVNRSTEQLKRQAAKSKPPSSSGSGIGQLRQIDDPRAQAFLEAQKQDPMLTRQGVPLAERQRIQRAQAAAAPSIEEQAARNAAENARQGRIAQMGTGEYLSQIPKSVVTGAASGVSGSLKGIAALAKKIDIFGAYEGKEVKDLATYQLGEYITSKAKEITGSNPDLEQEFFVGKAPAVIGQAAQFMLGGWATKAPKLTVTILGAGMTAGDAYDEVRALGGTDEEATNAALLAGSILGPTELLGMRGAMKAIAGTAREATLRAAMKTALREGRRDVIENALQETGQEFGQGIITGNQRSPEQLLEAGLLGGIGGTATVPLTLGSQIGGRRAREDAAQWRDFLSRREATRERQVEAQPDVTAQRAAVEPATAATQETNTNDPQGSSGPSGEVAQRFYHKDWGEVEVLPDQSGARPGRVKVAEVADPTKQHFPRRADLAGKGNQRMVPVKTPESTSLDAGLVDEGTAPSATRAYHGSRHDVDKFNLQKIGAGEGNQAYGWGLYFTDNAKVAEFYKGAGKTNKWTWPSEKAELRFEEFTPTEQYLIDWLDKPVNRHVGNRTEAIAGLEAEVQKPDRQVLKAEIEDAIQYLKSHPQLDVAEGGGKVYEVELAPRSDEWLEWDKPLSEQSQRVQRLLKDAGVFTPDKLANEFYWDLQAKAPGGRSTTGQKVYPEPNPRRASKFLRSIGVRGIRYYTGETRHKEGPKENNYVLFDDKDVRMVPAKSGSGIVEPAEQAASKPALLPPSEVAQPARAETTASTPELSDRANKISAETTSRRLPELRQGENYRKPLKEYGDTFFRESSAAKALELLPTSRISTDVTADRVYLSNTADLALGQGSNKGIVLEFEPSDLQGAVNTSKPTWKPLYDQGQAEFIAQYNKQGQYQRALKSVTVRPDAKMSRVERKQFDRALADMEEQGWTKNQQADGSVIYTRSVSAPSTPKLSRSTTAAGFKENLSLSQFVRKMGGIVPAEMYRGELDRLRMRDTGTTGLINQKAKQGNVKQTADIMMQAANDAGFRDPKTGQPFENPGDFLYAVERDVLGDKIHVRTGEEDFSAAEAEYYAEQEARIRAEETRDTFLESGRGAELFDRVRDGKASDAERSELTQLASEVGITTSELEDTLAGARAEIEGLEEVRSEGPRPATRPAEQLGFVQEGLTQQEAPPPQPSDQRGQLLREEQERQARLDPARTEAHAKLAELKRRGLTVDDYARQPDLMGNVPSAAEVAELREIEQVSALDRKSAGTAQKPSLFEQETPKAPENTPDQFGPGTTRVGEADPMRAGEGGFEEQIEERHAGFPLGRALFGDRPRIDTLGPKSINPEAEARMHAAEGVQPASVIRRAKDGLASVYHSFKRTFPEINPNKDDVSAVVNDHLRQLLAAPNYAKALAFDKIADITRNLGKGRMRVFSRNLILPDILKDIDAGLYDGKGLPFGYKNRTEIEKDLANFQQTAEETPAIKDALKRRQAFSRALTEKLVSLELLPADVLSDPRYYHRQVMEYVNNPVWAGTGSADVRLHKKGFQRGRVGGGDFNTRYQEAEFEWTAQALSLIARKESLARIQQIADIRPALDLEAKIWNAAHPETPKTWQDFVPETHRVWQPVKGSHFYPTMSITERTMDQILAGEKPFQESDVREIMALGKKRQQWVIPEEIAKTLDEFRPYHDEGPIANVWSQAQSSWKQWVLLNPVRVLKYNLNNISGDLDITLAYNPKILKHAPRAARELWNYQVKGQGSSSVKTSIQDAIRRGVVDSGLTIVEIPDINKTGAFRGLTSPDPNIIQRGVQSYWGGVKTFTTWRENSLRLAAYRHFQERIAKGEQVYAASNKSQIDAIKDPNDKAAKLARELVGDYGAVSHAGQWIRRHLIPFYSWVEINTPRYARLMRNLPHEGRSPTKAVVSRVLTGAPKLAVKASVLYVAAQLWNHAMFPDEEKELRTASRTPHLILGRNEDGSIRVLRVEGALADALEWFGAEDLPYDVADVAKGKKGAGPKAKLAEAVKAPVERIVQSWEPFSKTIFETASGRTAYPSLFEKGESFKVRPRIIRDRTESIARVFSLDSLYRRVTGRPSPPKGNGFNYIVDSVLTYRVDPGEAAYWDFRGKVIDWAKEQGKEFSAADPTARSNALYYYKQATKWRDETAAKKWLAEYHRLGGSDKGMAQSLRMGHPLGAVKKDDHAEFLDGLTDEERATLDLAEKWYTKTYGEIKTSRRPPKPPAPPKPEAPARP